jgi:hypothetical protein
MIVTTAQLGAIAGGNELDDALSARLRDLALVQLDALVVGLDGERAASLVGAYAEDCAAALREARSRIAELRAELGGGDPLALLDVPARQRASDAGIAGARRSAEKLLAQARAARAIARLQELAASLVESLFAAERRRGA